MDDKLEQLAITALQTANTCCCESDFILGFRLGHKACDEEIRELVDTCKRRMTSDNACGHPFDEDMSSALEAFETKRGVK